jgi:hypothetical protein
VTGAATASLLGLLFVAVSIRVETIAGGQSEGTGSTSSSRR